MTHLPPKAHNTFTRRLAYLQSRAWLPPALLLLALSSVFLFGGDRRGYIYRAGTHGHMSAKHLTISENLSSEHQFLMFVRQTLDTDGKLTYEPYNRFPIGGYALIKLTILPFGDDLSAKIYAARTLMQLCFAAAAFLAYLALRRITSSPWIALTATLLAFSSTYFLYYNDMISNEFMIDMFAVMLVFHGMVIFEQERHFRQLAVKTCTALFLGWHAYALLLPFIIFGLTRELINARSAASTPLLVLCQLKRTTLSLIRSRYLALGAIALFFGVSLLTFNFTNEYLALDREIPLTEIPSLQSIMYRTGLAPNTRESSPRWLQWRDYGERQFHRVGVMSLPYAFSPSYVDNDLREARLLPFIILGIAVSLASLIGLLFIRRYKMLLAALIVSGFCWALPMRYATGYPYHQFEALYYVGVTLGLFSLVLLCLRRLSGERLIAALSIAAALIFALSALRMAQLDNPSQITELHQAARADFEVIHSMTGGKTILINALPKFHERIKNIYYYYLSDRVIINGYENAAFTPRLPDFILTGSRADGLASLTPQNRVLFLYQYNDYNRHTAEIIEQAGAPRIRSDFDVYLHDKTLMYVKDACHLDDRRSPFFLAIFPADENDLPAQNRRHGFENLDFSFNENGIRQNRNRCISTIRLPDYDIARISTGQYTQRLDGSTQHLWEGEFRPAYRLINDRMRQINETIEQAGAPLIRSDFDVYLNDNMLIYVKNDCRMSDTTTDFFLAAFPVNEIDLPEGSRQHGFQNLDFRFHENGIRQSDDLCIAIAQLPDYDIARIHTGQYIQRADGSTEHTWEGEFRFTEEMR